MGLCNGALLCEQRPSYFASMRHSESLPASEFYHAVIAIIQRVRVNHGYPATSYQLHDKGHESGLVSSPQDTKIWNSHVIPLLTHIHEMVRRW